MAFLKEYDPQKYKQSQQRALELELYYEFLHDMVLIWGNVYYKKYNELHQYDIDGKVYHLGDYGDICSILSCYDNDDCLFNIKDLNPYSEIRKTKDLSYTMSWYVGFGGNIYYYISCADYTEVFRVLIYLPILINKSGTQTKANHLVRLFSLSTVKNL